MKLQKAELGEEKVPRSSLTNSDAKYAILEEMDDEGDGSSQPSSHDSWIWWISFR